MIAYSAALYKILLPYAEANFLIVLRYSEAMLGALLHQ